MTASESPDSSIGETQDSWVARRDECRSEKDSARKYTLPETGSNQGFVAFTKRLARAVLESAFRAAGIVGEELDDTMRPLGVDLTNLSADCISIADSIERSRQERRLARRYPYLYSWMKISEREAQIRADLRRSRGLSSYTELTLDMQEAQKALKALGPIAYEDLIRLRVRGRVSDYPSLVLPNEGVGKTFLEVKFRLQYVAEIIEQENKMPTLELVLIGFGLTGESIGVVLEEVKESWRNEVIGIVKKYGHLPKSPQTISPGKYILYPRDRRRRNGSQG
ncbi:hypothetical protein KC853_02150 [Candidatus Saccharibacteria bacterium]|nr:hypothetical protein [Candidatus Saccharibacteria bacterium]MCB9834493.1 hypothetical protein [Candidatus Nomurabacteria bacterium]